MQLTKSWLHQPHLTLTIDQLGIIVNEMVFHTTAANKQVENGLVN